MADRNFAKRTSVRGLCVDGSEPQRRNRLSMVPINVETFAAICTTGRTPKSRLWKSLYP
jgi:hypothetical protein